MDSSTAQVKVIFTTTEKDLQLPETKRQLLVPGDIKRYGLSRILNSESMLDTSSPVPLDFLANGAFLTTSIQDYLSREGLSSETTLTLQYVRSLLPPSYEASFEHDDWVGAVDLLSRTSPAGRLAASEGGGGVNLPSTPDRVASASYDGLVRIWNPQGEVVAVSSPAAAAGGGGGHSLRLNAVRWLSPKQLVSAGQDRKVVVWNYAEDGDGGGGAGTGTLRPNMELWGHEKGVRAMDANLSTRRLLTASSDGRIGLWSTSKRTAPQADPETLPSATAAAHGSGKKAKLAAASSSSSSSSTAQRGPLALFPVHEAPVTAALFHPHDATVAYTASEDHTVRTVDLTTQRPVSRLTTLHPLLCAAVLPRRNLVAAGSSARHVTLFDPRESSASSTTAAMVLRGHGNMVVALAAGPDDDYSLVSGAHDGTCRVWDLRSSARGVGGVGGGEDGVAGGGAAVGQSAYTIPREWLRGKKMPTAGDGAKVLAVAWDSTWGILSAGEDRRVQINRGRGLMAEAE